LLSPEKKLPARSKPMSKFTNEPLPQVRDERSGWLKEMQTHFRQTGFYRPEDLDRVLGDQRRGVSMPIASHQALAAKIQK
jgi:hypothetical protein